MKRILILFFILCGSAPIVFGQSVSGVIFDNDGALIVGAGVTLSKPDGGIIQRAKTETDGGFRFFGVEAGKYRLSVNADGFAEYGVTVEITESVYREVVLEPLHLAEFVSVTASYLAGTQGALERRPGSLERIGKKELEGARVLNFAEALRKISGVTIRNEEGFGLRPNISIRGSNPTRSRKVLLLEDGIPLSYAPYGDNSSYYHPPIERYESVEVLKGSGQIEHGPVTVAGVVNYITPNPSENAEIDIELIGGTRNYLNGRVGYSQSFGDTGLLMGFTRKQGNGSRENLRAGVNDFSSKIVHTINERNVLVAKYSHFDESSRITYSGLTEKEFVANPRQNPFRNDGLEFFREGFSLAHTGAFDGNTSLTTSFYTTYFSRDWWRQSSNSDQRPNRLGGDPDCLGMADLNSTCGNQGTPRDFRTLGIAPRFNFQFQSGGIRNNFNAGIRAHYETQNRRKWNGFSPNAREEGSQLIERSLRNSLAFSGFLQNRFLWRSVSITPGLRVEKINYERTNLVAGKFARTSILQFIPGIGVAYNPTRRMTVFAGVHRGFAPPSTSDILTKTGGVVDLDSELSWNSEIGVRTRPIRGVSIDAAMFSNDYENQIVPASVAGGSGSTRTNGGKTLQQGMEVNLQFDSSQVFSTTYNLFFRTAYTLLTKARFKGSRFSIFDSSPTTLITGNRLPYTPKHVATSSIGLAYLSLDAFLESNYISSQFSDDLNTINPTPNGQQGLITSQLYFNATANMSIEKWYSTFFVSAKNIFDRLYIVDRTRGIYPGNPRSIQLGWKFSFSR